MKSILRKNQIRIGVAALISMILMLIGATTAQSTAVKTDFSGFIHFCAGGPPDKAFETPGGATFHLRGASNQNVWETGNPLIDGAEMNVVNINFNPGGGNVHLDATVFPDAVMGTWEIAQTLKINADGTSSSHGVGHGTGELHGMTIQFSTGEPVDTGANPCAPLPSAPISGTIRVPAGPT